MQSIGNRNEEEGGGVKTARVSYIVGEKNISLNAGSIPHLIFTYLHANYPAVYQPKPLALELGLSYEAVKKGCQWLLEKGLLQRPRAPKKQQRGWYQSILTKENAAALEEPPVRMHNITLQVELSPQLPRTPPSLYTHGEKDHVGMPGGDLVGQRRVLFWEHGGYPYRVSFQFNPASVTVDLQASKHPLEQAGLVVFNQWFFGVLQAAGVDVVACEVRPVKFELNKDYELITVTPRMVEIRDLLDNSWLRIYRKYRNLHRIEIGTTWEGDKELVRLFHEFGKDIEKVGEEGSGLPSMFG